MKVNDKFKTRNGQIMTVYSFSNNSNFPLTCIDEKGRLLQFTKEGRFLANNLEHANDLMDKHFKSGHSDNGGDALIDPSGGPKNVA